MHQKIWVAKNSSPEICLYTFVELFVFKYLSDLEILKRLILSLRAIYAQPKCNINDSAPNMNKSNLKIPNDKIIIETEKLKKDLQESIKSGISSFQI